MLSSSSITQPLTPQKQVLICQNRTCLKQGAAGVLSAFEKYSLAHCTITKSGCMGQCGNGPMIRVLPDDIWYGQVQPDEVPAIVEQHLQHGQPVRAMLYARFHSKPQRH